MNTLGSSAGLRNWKSSALLVPHELDSRERGPVPPRSYAPMAILPFLLLDSYEIATGQRKGRHPTFHDAAFSRVLKTESLLALWLVRSPWTRWVRIARINERRFPLHLIFSAVFPALGSSWAGSPRCVPQAVGSSPPSGLEECENEGFPVYRGPRPSILQSWAAVGPPGSMNVLGQYLNARRPS